MSKPLASFQAIMALIAQGVINIDEGITEIQQHSPIHSAMRELCKFVNLGYVALTPKGEKFEKDEKKKRDEMYT